jgi:hypothetical protein
MAADVGHVDAAAVVGSDRVHRRRPGILGYVRAFYLALYIIGAVFSDPRAHSSLRVTSLRGSILCRSRRSGDGEH